MNIPKCTSWVVTSIFNHWCPTPIPIFPAIPHINDRMPMETMSLCNRAKSYSVNNYIFIIITKHLDYLCLFWCARAEYVFFVFLWIEFPKRATIAFSTFCGFYHHPFVGASNLTIYNFKTRHMFSHSFVYKNTYDE
jgi:hypothetical protein